MRTSLILHSGLLRSTGLYAAGLWLLALSGLPAPARAQSGRLFLVTSGGYDNNILGRSLASTSTQPDVTVASGFGQASPVADLEWRRGAWNLTASYSFLGSRFFRKEAGEYHDHAGTAGLSFRATPRLMLGASGNLESFRRTRFSEYDLNHAEVDFRVEGQPTAPLTLRGVLNFQRDHYPKSRVARLINGMPDTTDQADTPTNLELSATLRAAAGLTGEAGWVRLHTDSNIPRYRYDGHQIFAGLTLFPFPGGSVATTWLHEWRDYGLDRPERLITGRQDKSDTWSVELRQQWLTRITTFVTGSRLVYHSNLAGYGFNQTRVNAGFELLLGRVGVPTAAGPAPAGGLAASEAAQAADALAPRKTGQGVRFSCRAPGALSVMLAGTFNDWSRTTTPLADPDGDGLWEVELPLASGTYRYMFYIDGREWRKPEGAPLYEDDGFGLTNGVMVVP